MPGSAVWRRRCRPTLTTRRTETCSSQKSCAPAKRKGSGRSSLRLFRRRRRRRRKRRHTW
eukprot:6182380-Pleurochrysis_carterae.AAC.1